MNASKSNASEEIKATPPSGSPMRKWGAGLLVAAAVVASPGLALAQERAAELTRAPVVAIEAAAGRVKNLMDTDLSMSEGASAKESALTIWRRAKEAWKADPEGPTRAVKSLAERVSYDFTWNMQPERMRPKKVEIEARYVERNKVNASMEVDTGEPNWAARMAKLRVLTDGDGNLGMLGGSQEKGRDAQAVAVFVVGHEMAHSMFHPAYKELGRKSGEKALMAGFRSSSEVESVRVGVAAIQDADWARSVVNESFSDCVSLAYMAKKLPQADFEKLANSIEKKRKGVYNETLEDLEVAAATGRKESPEVHATYPSLVSMRARGYDALRAMSPEQSTAAAMQSAHEGLYVLISDGRDPLVRMAKDKGGAEAARSVALAGEALAEKNKASILARPELKESAGVAPDSKHSKDSAGMQAIRSSVSDPIVPDMVVSFMNNIKEKLIAARELKDERLKLASSVEVVAGPAPR